MAKQLIKIAAASSFVWSTLCLAGCGSYDSFRATFSITLTPEDGAMPPEAGLPVVVEGHGSQESHVPDPPAPSQGRGGGGASSIAQPALAVNISTHLKFNYERIIGQAVTGNQIGNSPLESLIGNVAGIVRDRDGTMYVCDSANNQIRAFPPSGSPRILLGANSGAAGQVGDNTPDAASLADGPMGLVIDQKGVLYYCDSNNGLIRYFRPGGRVYTLAGGGASEDDAITNSRNARLRQPFGLALDAQGNFYFTERQAGRIRKLDSTGRLETISTLSPDGIGPICVDSTGERLWVADKGQIFCFRYNRFTWERDTVATMPTTEVVTALAYTEPLGLVYASTSITPFGLENSKIAYIPQQVPLSVSPVTIAGTPSDDSAPESYTSATTSIADATQQPLALAGYCAFFVDTSDAGDGDSKSGQIYFGNNYSNGTNIHWGQVIRLTPEMW